MFNKQKFRACAMAAGMSIDDVAKSLRINVSTLYRKMNGSSDFTRTEIQKLQKILKLDLSMINEIFFA